MYNFNKKTTEEFLNQYTKEANAQFLICDIDSNMPQGQLIDELNIIEKQSED